MSDTFAVRRWLLLFALCVAASTAVARDFKVDPGDVPELREGEGYLVIAVDSDSRVRSLAIRSDDRAFASGRLYGIREGSTMGLYVLPAGTYRWDRLHVSSFAWTMRKDPEARFTVEAGRINYPGDLVYREPDMMHVANRGLRAMDWLDREHPRIAAAYEFSYRGTYPDPFPAFYRERVAAAGGARPEDATRALPAVGPLPIAVRELWKSPRIRSVSMSPAGKFVATAVEEGENDFRIELFDLERESVGTLALSVGTIGKLEWIADDILGALVRTLEGERQMFFRIDPDGKPTAHTMQRPGFVVDTLPGDADHVVFASMGSRGGLVLHRIDVREFDALGEYRFPLAERLNVGLENDRAWFTDGDGEVRTALVLTEEGRELVWGTAGRFETVLALDEPALFSPLSMSADGNRIYGLSEKDRGQAELVEFDPRERRIVRTVFSRPGTDVVGIVVGERHEPVAAKYYEGGYLVSEFFDPGRKQVVARLQNSFPGRTVSLLDSDSTGRRLLVGVDGSDQPLQLYHFDRETNRASLLDATAPWLAGRSFAPGHVLKVTAPDGLALEAFLTLPAGTGQRPLVVMPHGGPIGIADKRHFDPAVQFIASLGYAVLQVNFRGSSGYGVQFREAGYRGEGTTIEDDIDAAIAAALAAYPLDEKRMCVVGSSYGGQSGLSLAVRSPDRFRCIVSMSGVSDRILFFTASDAGRDEEGRERLEEVIGDPNTQLAQMIETSPLFRYDRLTTPVMLVHGAEDIRVDYEHTRRLVRMLSLAGRPPVLLEMPEEAHGIEDIDTLEKAWHGVAGFLRRHLDTPVASGIAPAAAR